MNCVNHEDRKAEWLVEDAAPYEHYYMPLCEECFQELREMEGEMNLTFDYIANLSLDQIISRANEREKYWQKRYENLLKELSAARKLCNLKPGQLPSEALAQQASSSQDKTNEVKRQ